MQRSKNQVAKTLYPSGIVVDRENIHYRTQNQNVFIEYIQIYNEQLGTNKKAE
jgi:hypothetical protein